MGEREIGRLGDSLCLIQAVVSGRGAVSGRHWQRFAVLPHDVARGLDRDFLDVRGGCGNF
jgi:hypothetical protein